MMIIFNKHSRKRITLGGCGKIVYFNSSFCWKEHAYRNRLLLNPTVRVGPYNLTKKRQTIPALDQIILPVSSAENQPLFGRIFKLFRSKCSRKCSGIFNPRSWVIYFQRMRVLIAWREIYIPVEYQWTLFWITYEMCDLLYNPRHCYFQDEDWNKHMERLTWEKTRSRVIPTGHIALCDIVNNIWDVLICWHSQITKIFHQKVWKKVYINPDVNFCNYPAWYPI